MELPVAELASAHGLCLAVCVAADVPALAAPAGLDAALDGLHPAERMAAARLAPARCRDWVAGRAALRAALRRLDPDLDAGPIDSDDRGAPRLPPGWVGSISHKRGIAVALADRDRGWTIGIDVEHDAPPRLDIGRRVLTPGEAETLARLDAAARGLAVTLHFALKEAIYKAIDPHLRRYVGFGEVAVAPAPDGTVRVDSALALTVEAAWSRAGGFLVCTARARR